VSSARQILDIPIDKRNSYYQILGLSREATVDQIRKAFRKLSLIYHPDKNSGDEEAFKKISMVYEVLGDPQKKTSYDLHGHTVGKPEAKQSEESIDVHFLDGESDAKFKSFVKEILGIINPSKANVLIQPQGRSTYYKEDYYEIGQDANEDADSLSEQEKRNFVRIVFYVITHADSNREEAAAILPIGYPACLEYGRLLQYSISTINLILSSYDTYKQEIDHLIKDCQSALEYTTYWNESQASSFPLRAQILIYNKKDLYIQFFPPKKVQAEELKEVFEKLKKELPFKEKLKINENGSAEIDWADAQWQIPDKNEINDIFERRRKEVKFIHYAKEFHKTPYSSDQEELLKKHPDEIDKLRQMLYFSAHSKKCLSCGVHLSAGMLQNKIRASESLTPHEKMSLVLEAISMGVYEFDDYSFIQKSNLSDYQTTIFLDLVKHYSKKKVEDFINFFQIKDLDGQHRMRSGNTPLHEAIEKLIFLEKETEAIIFDDIPKKIRIKNEERETFEIIQFLLEKGATLKAENNNGKTPLDYLKCCKKNETRNKVIEIQNEIEKKAKSASEEKPEEKQEEKPKLTLEEESLR